MAHILGKMPMQGNIDVTCGLYEFKRARELEDRRLYLYGEIENIDVDERDYYGGISKTSKLVEEIMEINRFDEGIDPEQREPIRLYINSPGGEVTEGFALVAAMELSKTPIHTINVGEAASMAFLIGLVGSRRFALPHSIFMMHEPSGLVVGKFSDMEDKVKFNRKFNNEHIKTLVMKRSKMSETEYEELSKKDYFMMPDDALAHGFIDEIVTDIDTIL